MDINNPNESNKNVTMLIAACISLIILVLAYVAIQNSGFSDKDTALVADAGISAAINKNIADINNFNSNLELFASDEVVAQELDSILDEVGEINAAAMSLTNDENGLSGIESELNSITSDETVNNEIDKALQEISL